MEYVKSWLASAKVCWHGLEAYTPLSAQTEQIETRNHMECHKCSGDGDPPINYDFSNAAWWVSPEWSSSYPYILLVTDPC